MNPSQHVEIENKMSKAIRVENLEKKYRGKKGKYISAINGINFEIEAGSIFGFVGPNGAGKTTTIKILCGLAFPTRGCAYLFDEPVSHPSARNTIGYLSEVSAYSPYFEAQELLVALGRLHGIPYRECKEKALQLLQRVGLYERRKSRLGEFSKGMLQRFGIAQALLHDPKILILDEPTSGLDPIAQRGVLNILHDLKGTGMTIFFSSHQLVEVEGLCDYVGIISRGDLIFNGTLSQLEAMETQTPFLVRYQEPNHKTLNLQVTTRSSRNLEGNIKEICIDRNFLDKALNEIHSAGGTVVAVLPQRFPLEEIFVRMITEHEGEASLS
jgi:ABC-2 type transport system ATP-binding protein